MAAQPTMAPAPAPTPAYDPYAAMKPPAGRSFDLRPVDDGAPIENVRAKGGKAMLLTGAIFFAVGAALGGGFGGAAVGRRAYNSANKAARDIRAEVEEMHKTVTQVATAVEQSRQRTKQALAYDPRLIEDLGKVKLDPRPGTTKIFRGDYSRLEDIAVDRLMTYYYDTINLYGEVERFVKKTSADKTSLDAFAAKSAAGGGAPGLLGVIFDQRGKVAIGNLVEIGGAVCPGGATECDPAAIEGYQVRANSGSSWFTRKVAPKPDLGTLVPIERTQLMEAVMAGSPDQARMEQYRQRLNNITMSVVRIAAIQKELMEAINKAAARQDLTTL
jgi:hypothetical protein